MMLSIIAAAAAAATAPSPASPAQVAPQAMVCQFRAVHVGDLTPDYRREGAGDTMTLTFDRIDSQAGLAELSGNSGAAPVIFQHEARQMQFIERTETGNLTLTSVFGDGKARKPMPAAHSRHVEVSPGLVAVSQYVGTCTPRRQTAEAKAGPSPGKPAKSAATKSAGLRAAR